MKILLRFKFFHYIRFIDSENLFHLYFDRKYDKVLTFNIVHFPNFEISASLLLAPHPTVSKFDKRRCRLLAEIRYLESCHYRNLEIFRISACLGPERYQNPVYLDILRHI